MTAIPNKLRILHLSDIHFRDAAGSDDNALNYICFPAILAERESTGRAAERDGLERLATR